MILTLLSSGGKNCWEGNEQANKMLKNSIKKKITLRTGTAYYRAKKEKYYAK